MVSRKSWVSALSIALVAGITVWADDISLEGVRCIVAPKPATAGKSAEYKDGKVFFCCGGCLGKFKAEPAKFATSANMQLVATKQYEQKACPLSGGPLNPETKIKVGDAEVAFCCANCKGKVEAAEGQAKADMVFSDKAFEKGKFTKVAAK